MKKYTPRDSNNVPAILGNNNGETVPLSVSPDGELLTKSIITNPTKYQLVDVLNIDFSIPRNKELFQIEFDSIAIANLNGSFFMHINNKQMTIKKCLSMLVSSNNISISNDQQTGSAEIWLFKIKEVI